MAMVLLLPFLELEGHTASSPEDEGMAHGHVHNSVMHCWKVAESCDYGLCQHLLKKKRHALFSAKNKGQMTVDQADQQHQPCTPD